MMSTINIFTVNRELPTLTLTLIRDNISPAIFFLIENALGEDLSHKAGLRRKHISQLDVRQITEREREENKYTCTIYFNRRTRLAE